MPAADLAAGGCAQPTASEISVIPVPLLIPTRSHREREAVEELRSSPAGQALLHACRLRGRSARPLIALSVMASRGQRGGRDLCLEPGG